MSSGDWLIRAFRMNWRKGRGAHRHATVTTPAGRSIYVTESPTGRAMSIYVDNQKWVRA